MRRTLKDGIKSRSMREILSEQRRVVEHGDQIGMIAWTKEETDKPEAKINSIITPFGFGN